jgi:hypothetical protein
VDRHPEGRPQPHQRAEAGRQEQRGLLQTLKIDDLGAQAISLAISLRYERAA